MCTCQSDPRQTLNRAANYGQTDVRASYAATRLNLCTQQTNCMFASFSPQHQFERVRVQTRTKRCDVNCIDKENHGCQTTFQINLTTLTETRCPLQNPTRLQMRFYGDTAQKLATFIFSRLFRFEIESVSLPVPNCAHAGRFDRFIFEPNIPR